ncbi:MULTISPECIES: hypothetical protein [Chroococcidiopsis]|jgi:hypothetical protein|uniref:NifZ family protein n=2 Tax=Chroococcidiopsis TaxID=54298 RepID=K9U6P2_CHRTP|nr:MULTISPECIES: hypothetical protein [Chroococcidiopsis]MBE9019976.1 hypothetical protein [Chroococcidiopsidales cyanobacterium LEGE 13417]OWY69173.1 hypothetical protein B7486_21735 [cyanobacterium TDX16]PSB40408.1 hypothetical protein C7B80_33495 [Cyanosarcina cf. burmensis CCALA 770]AFY90505.1 hypothetical protein Chro_5132 [Chroococcidiopsis thermalis PCC 7203]MDZ4878400.1 hypothetical protein [Chroococcidiopsis cubana SAG 39.79]
MFQVGDRVIHHASGQSGNVIGYGHQIIDGVYQPTLIVRVVRDRELGQTGVVEDLSANWIPSEEEIHSQVA